MMGLLTLKQFRRLILADPMVNQIPEIDHAIVDDFVNLAHVEVATTIEFEALKRCADLETVDEVGDYNLPDNLAAILSISDKTTDGKVLRTTLRNFHRLSIGEAGYPKYYVRLGNTIKFWPTPDDVYELEMFYLGPPTPLVLAEDTTILPPAYDQPILLLGRANLLHTYNQFDVADKVAQRAHAMLATRQKDGDHDEPMDGPSFIARSWEEVASARPTSERVDRFP